MLPPSQWLAKKLMTWGLSAFLLGTVVACHRVNIENDPSEKAKAISVAQGYIQALYDANLDKAIGLTSLPFWEDGLMYTDLKSYVKAVQKEFSSEPGMGKLAFEKARFFTREDIEVLGDGAKAINELKNKGFPLDGVYFVVLAIRVEAQDISGVVLVKQEKGMWKVVGIDE